MESAQVLSLLLLGLAVVGVFIEIPFVSQYAFRVAIAAYILRLVTKIPTPPPTSVRVACVWLWHIPAIVGV